MATTVVLASVLPLNSFSAHCPCLTWLKFVISYEKKGSGNAAPGVLGGSEASEAFLLR